MRTERIITSRLVLAAGRRADHQAQVDNPTVASVHVPKIIVREEEVARAGHRDHRQAPEGEAAEGAGAKERGRQGSAKEPARDNAARVAALAFARACRSRTEGNLPRFPRRGTRCPRRCRGARPGERTEGPGFPPLPPFLLSQSQS